MNKRLRVIATYPVPLRLGVFILLLLFVADETFVLNPVLGDTDLQLEVENNLGNLENVNPDQITNPVLDPDPPMLRNTDPAAIDIANILPANARRQRRIRFNLPVLR